MDKNPSINRKTLKITREGGEKADRGEKPIDWGIWKICEQMESKTCKNYLFHYDGEEYRQGEAGKGVY